ncbi:MAG: hypothetical protein JSR80_02030 [Verrucomicrobia bacterium]|nr:hypothetical protein [Verrucomicrobiota bacterium]
MTHKQLAIASAVIWLCMALFLLLRGVYLLRGVEHGMAYGIVAVFLGWIKGKFVLERVAGIYVRRIEALPNPSPLHKIYGLRAYVLLVVMMALGITLNALGAPAALRGLILVAVGCGLLQGASVTFRATPSLAHRT